MITELYTEKIEAYLRNELSVRERMAMQRKLRQDPEFAKVVQAHQLLNHALQHKIDQEIEPFVTPRSTSGEAPGLWVYHSRTIKRLAVAASLALLCVLGAHYLLPTFNATEHITQQIRTVDPISFSVAGENDQLLFDGQEAYNKKDYAKAVAFFDQYLETQPQGNYEVLLFKGIALRQLNQLEASQEILQELIRTSSQHYAGTEAAWQLALNYVQQYNYEAARQQLLQIMDNSDSDRANGLYRRIRFM